MAQVLLGVIATGWLGRFLFRERTCPKCMGHGWCRHCVGGKRRLIGTRVIERLLHA